MYALFRTTRRVGSTDGSPDLRARGRVCPLSPTATKVKNRYTGPERAAEPRCKLKLNTSQS